LSKLKKYHPSGNSNFDNLGIFQSLYVRNLMGKILQISLKLNFTPNALGCYGLTLKRLIERRRFSVDDQSPLSNNAGKSTHFRLESGRRQIRTIEAQKKW